MQVIYSIGLVCLGLIIALLTGVLPESPFVAYIDLSGVNDYLGYINYFVPVSEAIVIGEAWLTCMGIYYLVKLGEKAIKLVCDIVPF